MKKPEPIEIEETEVEQLIEKAAQGRLDGTDQKRLVPLLRTLLWIQWTLLETRIGLSKLKRLLFGEKTEKRPRKPQDSDTGDDDGEKAPAAMARRVAVLIAHRGVAHPRRPRGRRQHKRVNQTRLKPAVMVVARRRIIPAPRRFFARMIRVRQAIRAPSVSAAGCILYHPWSACALAVSHWRG